MNLSEAEKTIMKTKIAMGQYSANNNNTLAESRFRTKLFDMFTEKNYRLDYDNVCNLFGFEPTLSEISFYLSAIEMTPDQARTVSGHIGNLAVSVLEFNMIQADQPEAVIRAIA